VAQHQQQHLRNPLPICEASCALVEADRSTLVVQVELQRKLLQEYEKREQKRKVSCNCSGIVSV
jgi:hypothetical protein